MPTNPRIVVDFLANTSALHAGMAAAGAAVIAFGASSVRAATEDAESQALLAQALTNTAGATQSQIAASEEYIANLSRQAAIADDELRPALGNLVRATGDVSTAQEGLALATDIAAARGQSVESVSQALARAYAGNTTALKRMGVATEDAAGNALSLDEIMANASQTFGGTAATAAGTTAGEMRNASIQFGEFQEQLGGAVMPIVAEFAGVLLDSLIPALQDVAGFIEDNIGWLGPLALVLGTVAGAVWAANTATAAWAAIQAAASTATAVWSGIQTAFNVVMGLNPVVAVVAAVVALVAAVVLAYQKVDWFRALVDAAGDVIQAAFAAVVDAFQWLWDKARAVFDWIADHWQTLLAVLTGPIGIAVALIVGNFDTLKAAATSVFEWIRDKFQAVVDFLRGIVATISGVVSGIVDAIKGPINVIIRAWNQLEFSVPRIEVDLPGPLGTVGAGPWTFGLPDLPQLAKGGVLTRPTAFIGGEAGTEIVAPESLLRSIVGEARGGVVYQVNVSVAPTADLAAVGRATVEAITAYERTGGRAWRAAQIA